MSEGKIIKRVIFWLILIVLPSFAAAQTQEYKDYTVEKGDTLWDISHKELQDPFLWPKVWKENPNIKNPDKIYPGQKIKIPLYLLQKEVVPIIKPLAKRVIEAEIPKEKPAEKRIEPKKREYLVNKHVLTSSGYITEKIHSVGEITDIAPGRTVIGKDDRAYIKVNRPVKKGDKFYVIVPIEKVIHPKTGVTLGHLVDIRGTVEVIGQEPNDDPLVLVTNAYYDVYTGNLLDDYYELEPPLAPENPRKPNINGYIVASKHLHLISIPYDIAYIDKGKNDGLEVGDLLATTMQSKHKIYNGLIQVINMKDSTATVIIRKSTDSITKGDGVTGVKQE
jgi:hypothetical protein